jgi:hypothetical protein
MRLVTEQAGIGHACAYLAVVEGIKVLENGVRNLKLLYERCLEKARQLPRREEPPEMKAIGR